MAEKRPNVAKMFYFIDTSLQNSVYLVTNEKPSQSHIAERCQLGIFVIHITKQLPKNG
ncbi:hypothetical protein HMPREF0454_02681 [Hafnia alvei ATCC 51873]|uniref:Uncharacterized protein n=1 Tax=Hafnia alvei ATCC 51873 TaxID=1002364 RepID=G9Y7Z5_HAFAL|nr:hypothetical protein HMPREF0454_02681 [Hafnia alvei ATCC 51873]